MENNEELIKVESETKYVSFAMRKFGISKFMIMLGEALSYADPESAYKIKIAFPSLWQEYLNEYFNNFNILEIGSETICDACNKIYSKSEISTFKSRSICTECEPEIIEYFNKYAEEQYKLAFEEILSYSTKEFNSIIKVAFEKIIQEYRDKFLEKAIIELRRNKK